MTVEITAFDEEEALRFVTEHRITEQTTAEARARELPTQVLHVHERLRLEIEIWPPCDGSMSRPERSLNRESPELDVVAL